MLECDFGKQDEKEKNAMVSALSMLTIYTNPFNLCFKIGSSDGRFGVHVSLGPTRIYRPIVFSEAVFASKEDAVSSIAGLLEYSIKLGGNRQTGSDVQVYVSSLLLGCEGPYLDQTLCDCILADLRSERGQADTFNYGR